MCVCACDGVQVHTLTTERDELRNEKAGIESELSEVSAHLLRSTQTHIPHVYVCAYVYVRKYDHMISIRVFLYHSVNEV